MKKVLVTGAGGFIGSHLTEDLVRRGLDVRAFVFYNSLNSWGWLDHSEPEIKESIEVFGGDIRDRYAVNRAMRGCDTVFHLAALVGIPYSYHAPAVYIDTNVKGTLNILQAANELDVEKIVYTSTSEVYGTARFVPITEDHPLQGQSPYSASKIGGEQLALSFYLSFQTPVAIIRLFNTYGPRQSARAIIPAVIIQILGGKKRIRVGALSPTRDFNYIQDTVGGLLAVAESEEAIGEIINIGSSFEISIGETVELIAEIMKTDIEIKIEKQRLRPAMSEVRRLWADNTKAKNIVNWQPHYAGRKGFRKGLKKTIDWFMKPQNLKNYKINLYNI